MTTRTALFALLAMWGVGSTACLPALAEEAAAEADGSEDRSALSGFTDRVWSRTEDGGLPGSMKVFLSDGTLIEDSCWETHRLSPWRIVSETAVSWNEDGIDIDATIVSLTEAELVLRLRLADGAVEERYEAATVPYLCPDIPKG